ncbi:MAG: sigma-70 family RNA polymerase sigma factor [Verrucomicrobia bacterium]|nr:sigma-70 family RNA polymerase sigma factor [Verrucomicrobiota bacterium]
MIKGANLNRRSRKKSFSARVSGRSLDPEEILLRFIRLGFSSPVRVIVCLLRSHLRWSAEDITANFFDVPLRTLAERIEEAFAEKLEVPSLTAGVYLATLRRRLERPWRRGGRRRRDCLDADRPPPPLLGDTTLRAHLPQDAAAVEAVASAMDVRLRALKFKWTSRTTFRVFCEAHNKDLPNFIRARMRADSQEAEDIAQDTWQMVFKKRKTYDPSRSSLPAFLKYWAGVMILRYLYEKLRDAELFITFTDLLRRFPDLEAEPELDNVLAYVKGTLLADDVDHEALDLVHFQTQKILLSLSQPANQTLSAVLVLRFGVKPRTLAAKLSRTPLRRLAQKVEDCCVTGCDLPEDQVRACFQPLRSQLREKFNDAVKGLKKPAKYAHLRRRMIGRLTLAECCGPRRLSVRRMAVIISNWCHEVRARVAKQALKDAKFRADLNSLPLDARARLLPKPRPSKRRGATSGTVAQPPRPPQLPNVRHPQAGSAPARRWA